MFDILDSGRSDVYIDFTVFCIVCVWRPVFRFFSRNNMLRSSTHLKGGFKLQIESNTYIYEHQWKNLKIVWYHQVRLPTIKNLSA